MKGSNDYDVAVVGGGVAGAAFATAMAREGADVIVLERERVFRDRVRGEWLAPWGAAEARLLGLEDAFAAAGATRLPSLAGRRGRPRLQATPEGDVALTFSHPALQESLLAAAGAAGATVVRGARVREVLPGEPHAVGYDVDGSRLSAAARIVIGADGRSSLVRRAMGAAASPRGSQRMLSGVRLAGVAGDPEVGYFVIDDESASLAALFPQGGGQARAYVFAPGESGASFTGARGLDRFREALQRHGVPAEVLSDAVQAGPLASFATTDWTVERPAGDGLALIGDAAGVSDPTWGMGIAIALRDARVLAQALQGAARWPEALAAYADERRAYFSTVVTAESWMSELMLTPGADAAERRRRAQRAWSAEPDRALDLPGLGPAVDVSPRGRRRFFADDLINPEQTRSAA